MPRTQNVQDWQAAEARIWAILEESARRHEKWEEEAKQRAEEDKRWKEEVKQRAEEAKQREDALNKQMAETDKKIAALSDNIGGLNRSTGELVEILIAAHLWEKFPEYNLQRAYHRIPIYDEKNQLKTDIDILLVNTEWAMVVEVKRYAEVRDIDHHVERMARILKYPPAELKLAPNLKILAAIAGGIVDPDAAVYAHQCGFFVLELAGESVVRIPEPAEFQPKEW